MADKKFPESNLPIRQTTELLPSVFRTPANQKFMEAVVDPLVQPGVLQKNVGYVGRRYGKTYRGSDIYLDTDSTLRSRYQLEPGVIFKHNDKISGFYDYLDFKNQLKFFGNNEERDYLATNQEHYSWNPPIDWDKFVNYREYYWVPSGPPSVAVQGNRPGVTSTYNVVLGTTSSYIFRPDGYTNNPTITLYRGQTYKFKINAPGQGFAIKTNYDTASLTWDPNKAYDLNALVVYDNKLWRSIAEVVPGTVPEDSSKFWKYVDSASNASSLDYNDGVTNNGTENGTITFSVPYNSPDVLYYQSRVDVDRFGKFLIGNIEDNTTIDVNKEIIGKEQYTSSNGVEFSNGLIVEFRGRVAPAKYAKDIWLVEGVGEGIKLINFADLEVPAVNNIIPAVVFDNAGFDTEPFDDASNYPGSKDYFTISRSSNDANPWSRYNRWFHKSVLDFAYRFRGDEFPATESSRAKRPIIEFLPDLQLFNHGSVAKNSVDYIETTTNDIFSIIEGSDGYIVDHESLFDGARLLVVSDTDSLVNNKIFVVTFINHNNRRQIALREADDALPVLGEGVLVKRGRDNAGVMYHFDGNTWVKSQQKTKVNQPPLFDAFDENEISFSDPATYPINNFKGTKILSYKEGNGVVDSELGISLSYLNIDNVGDIVFDWNWGTDSFVYTKDEILTTQRISNGYFKFNPNHVYDNGWMITDNTYIQPLIDSVVVSAEETNTITLTSIYWDDDANAVINFYLNGARIKDSYIRNNNEFSFLTRTFVKNDVVSVKIITSAEPRTSYYEIPVGIEKNPLNQEVETFTLGQASDHVSSAVEFNVDFIGSVPGSNNLRDLPVGYKKHAKRFMKHSSSAPLAISLLCDKTNNIVKALQYAKSSYTSFKNSFLTRASELEYNDNISDFVDEILVDLTKTKNQENAFSDSDMIGTGAYTSIDYVVEDDGIKTFALSTRFTLTEQSRRAVYVYINGEQLLHERDYNFNNNFGFITITAPIYENDQIQIREYVSTSSCFIPPTPTKLGMYRKFTPVKFLDDTYLEPREVIQGHDGSIMFAFGDFRDDLLLELEYRIYNNIKQEYNESVFNIDDIIGGYYGSAEFKKEQVDAVVNQEFLRWIQNTDINYTENSYFRETETFTYTYSNMTDPSGTQNLPGWWRGVYQWFYDTDHPHRSPWEMLGFSQKPNWWENEYGPAPYTSNNLILWEDLAGGIIRQGNRAGIYDRYKRPTLLNHIPVDGDGNLLSPLDSGLAGNFVLINNKGSFKFGDIAPVEYAWRISSEWPFSVVIALCLLKPFEFISTNFDRTKVKVNKLGQTVNVNTNTFITLDQYTIPTLDKDPCAGLVNYLVDYSKSRKIPVSLIESKIYNINVALSSRLSGFVDKSQQRYLLDSKNPRSSSSSVYVPTENYDIIFNVSSPISSISYSGVILEKTEGGWFVSGYDTLYPYFNYYEGIATQTDPVITVGGVSESYVNWTANATYPNGQIALYRNYYYRSLKTHQAGNNFDTTLWKQLPELPIVNGTTAVRRRNFNRNRVLKLSYGTKLNSIQEVVDFLLGYEQYLLSLGLKFDRYDRENQVSQNWLTSCKEFMFWTKHNWAIRSLITLSPAASGIDLEVPVGVADNLLDSFYDYQVFKSDGTVLEPKFINVSRTFQNISVETTNTTDGIYFIRLNFVLKEHVTIFDDRTVFNDVIYDKTTGYRQERVKTQGFRTTDWDGDYTSPGFLFDNVNIEAWQPFVDYKLGDIVEYQSKYWTSQENQLATETFDDSKWSILDTTPEKQLVANFDYKVNLFDDYYDAASEGIGQSQRELARHSIGYQERKYLQDLAEDPVTQFQLYQGFIREKGTSNAITKIFDKLSRAGENSIKLDEEWAFRVGRFGGVDQIREIEFSLVKDKFVTDPQPIIVSNDYVQYPDDQYYRITEGDFTVAPYPFKTTVNEIDLKSEPFKTAGYVRSDQVQFVVKTIEDILSLDITEFADNDNVWITFYSNDTASSKFKKNPYWNVWRFNEVTSLEIISATKTGSTVEIVFDLPHNIKIDDIVGIRTIANLVGFYKVKETSVLSITVEVPSDATDPEKDISTVDRICLFAEVRYSSYADINEQAAALSKENSKAWVDNNGNNLWEVIEKKKQYTSTNISSYGGLENIVPGPSKTGTKVIYDSFNRHIITSVPGLGYILTYSDSTNVDVRDIFNAPEWARVDLKNSFGNELAVSGDGKWLIVGAPLASGLASEFVTVEDSRLPVGTEPDVEEIAGFDNQGAIYLYEKVGSYWNLKVTNGVVVSPDPAQDERFGSKVSIGKDVNGVYFMAVSAPGANNNAGRVYIFRNDGTENSEWKIDTKQTNDLGMVEFQDSSTVVEGDQFGYSISLNQDAGLLVVGAPFANDISNDVAYNETGKVFVFAQTKDDKYELRQTISHSTLSGELDDSSGIGTGDMLGASVIINGSSYDSSSETLLISSPKADITSGNNRGVVFVFKETLDSSGIHFNLHQRLSSYETEPAEYYPYFGHSMAMTADASKIVIGACNLEKESTGAVYVFDLKDTDYFLTEKLESQLSINESFGASVDVNGSTIVVGSPNYTDAQGNRFGTVRVFRKLAGTSSWEAIATQQPTVNIDKIRSIALYDTVNNEKIDDIDFVDSAKLKILNVAEQELTFKTPYDPAVYSSYVPATSLEVGKTYEIKTLGTTNWNSVAGTEFINYSVGDIVTVVNVGNGNGEAILEGTTVDPTIAWTTQNVGKLWWNLSTAKWIHYEQGDISYKTGNWSQLAEGASIDVYEWVETPLLPSEWSALADTNEGLAENISGQPLYPNDNVYSVKELYNDYTGLPTSTLYYFWVKNTVVLPENVIGRRISSSEVASLINNPKGSGEKFIAFAGEDQFVAYNFAGSVTKTGTVINIEYYNNTNTINPIHNEYQLLTEGVDGSLPTISLETKWVDSLIGYDAVGNAVPDANLPAKQRYGISFRPRQSMFVNRQQALKIAIEYVNSVLLTDVFADFVDRSNLELVDGKPDSVLNLYDAEVDTELDLDTVITSRLKQAKIELSIADGEIESVNIVEPGFGYKVAPPVIIDGDGTGAKVELTIDIKGRVTSANIVRKGKRYTTANAEVRSYSVLVNSDTENNNFWAIYSWDDIRKFFFRSQTQSFDTTRYWTTVDWWKAGYSIGSRIVKEIVTINEESTISVEAGDLIRIKEYSSGGWAVFERTSVDSQSFLEKYTIVGRESGTFQFKNTLYDLTSMGIGYDNNRSFDIGEYDIENFRELRNIFKAIKEDIFNGDYSVEWNKLFFVCIRHVFSEQQYVDWAFKTSFLNAIHNVGSLEQKLNYRSDNLSSFQDYIDEVKPYRTTIREYVSRYDNLENSNTAITDFDLPARYSYVDGKVSRVTELDETVNEYPWKSWLDNKGFSIVSIKISDPGADYVQPPTVVITGNGTGATAKAYITSGKVSTVLVTNPGYGYTETPVVSLVGGNGESLKNAKVIAILGDTKVRNFKLGMKYDRITKTGQYLNFVQAEPTIIANGYTAAFDLTYPITRDKSKINILKNGSVVFDDQYRVTLFTVTSGTYQYQRGKIIFNETPAKGDVISISYEKDDAILDSVNRINKYYSPVSGMRGKDIPQLMTGIDFGGVQVQGSSFGVTGGWDSLPWYTDNWNSVDPSSDYYYIFASPDYEDSRVYRTGAEVNYEGKIYKLFGVTTSQGVTPVEDPSRWQIKNLTSITLPYVPEKGQLINIYRKLGTMVNSETGVSIIDYRNSVVYNLNDVIRFNGFYYRCASLEPISNLDPDEALNLWARIPETFRIDDLYWGIDDSSTLANTDALMPTFIGDGINNVVELGRYFTVLPHETLIFRPDDSDGSTNILSSDVLDTSISGGSFLKDIEGAYSTANGKLAEEIIVDGVGFGTVDYVPAPEENVPGQVLDSLCITVFQKHLEDPTKVSAYNMHKDMLNMHYYKRYSLGKYVLAKDFYYYDTTMVLNTVDGLSQPVVTSNIPGIIKIGGERIEYLRITGNSLGQLRRGSYGTAIREMYPAGTPVADIGYAQTIPYSDSQEKTDIFYNTTQLRYDGSTNSFIVTDPIYVGAVLNNEDGTLVANKNNIVITVTNTASGIVTTLSSDQIEVDIDGELYTITINDSVEITDLDLVVVHPLLIPISGFVPAVQEQSVSVGNTWYRETIPSNFGQSDDVEVFVGGHRLRKNPVSVYDETLGLISPLSDRDVEAEFSVDGNTQYIRLTNPPENAGTKITVIKRIGNIWYEKGDTTASKGINLLDNDTPPARFIAQKTTDIPE